jgi:hypothetical protein
VICDNFTDASLVKCHRACLGSGRLAKKRLFSAIFSPFFPAMRHQKGKKLTKNSSFLSQSPNPKHALSLAIFEKTYCNRI